MNDLFVLHFQKIDPIVKGCKRFEKYPSIGSPGLVRIYMYLSLNIYKF